MGVGKEGKKGYFEQNQQNCQPSFSLLLIFDLINEVICIRFFIFIILFDDRLIEKMTKN
jgi:hypothetical protein